MHYWGLRRCPHRGHWKRNNVCKDQKSISHIHLCLSNKIVQDFLKEKTVAALWLRLEQLCMRKILTSKLHLKHRLYSHHLVEGMPLEDYLNICKDIITNLETVEVKYDEDLELILLCSFSRIPFCIVVKLLLWMKYMMSYFQMIR